MKARECQIVLLLIDKFRSPVGWDLKCYDFWTDNNATLRARVDPPLGGDAIDSLMANFSWKLRGLGNMLCSGCGL